jgi:hypothetical protein
MVMRKAFAKRQAKLRLPLEEKHDSLDPQKRKAISR